MASSEMVIVARRVPVAVGVNVTLMVQFDPAATLDPQLSVCEKSPALLPVTEILEMFRSAFPVFVRVADLTALFVPTDWFPKEMLVGETLATVDVPVPESATVCGLPAAPSVIVRVAARLPLAEGLKVTLMAQLAPAATLDPQLLDCAKLLELLPVTAMLAMVKSALPVFVRVTV